MKSYTERTTPSPLGTALYPQIETTVSAIKFTRCPMGYHLRRKTAQSRTQDSVFVRWLGLIPSVFSHNCIRRIRDEEASLFGVVSRFLDLTALAAKGCDASLENATHCFSQPGQYSQHQLDPSMAAIK